MDNRYIGMFDSGVGGITVLKEVIKALPNEKIMYLGDTKSFPYGNKSKENIIELTKRGINFLVNQNVKAVIIACGTATSQALDVVAPLFNVPIIGIIDPTAYYVANNSDLRKVGVVATSGTINSNAWENSILKLNSNLTIINKACPLLAPMAEEGWIDNDVAKLAVKEYMKGLNDVDALILGCTHYPLFYNLFRAELKPSAEIINTGTMVASFLQNTFNSSFFNHSSPSDIKIYLTDTECNFINVAEKLLQKRISRIYKCELPLVFNQNNE